MAFKILGPEKMYEDFELIARDMEEGILYVSPAHPDPVVVIEVQEFYRRTMFGYERWRNIWMLDRGEIRQGSFNDEEPMGWVRFK